jgi:transposase-like protein
MRREISHIGVVLALVVILLVASAFLSNKAEPTATVLTMEPSQRMMVSGPAAVPLYPMAAAGKPVPDQSVELVSGKTDDPGTSQQIQEKPERVDQRRAKTDAVNAAFEINDGPAIGKYPFSPEFGESLSWAPAASNASVEPAVEQAGLEIWIVPPLPGVTFSLNGRLFTSDENGVARIQVPQSGRGTYHLKVVTVEMAKADIRAKFIRWGDEVFVPYRDIRVPRRRPLRVGFEVSHRAGPIFADLSRQPVDPARITSMELKASDGQFYAFGDTETRWLLANRIVDRQHGIEESRVLYSIMNITMDGSNVVNAAQQRFYLDPNDVWPIELLLYSARFTARDALFHFPIGSGIRLEYPDGHSQDFPFDSDAELKVEALARGLYRVTVVGAQGMAPPTPIALSRDQDIELLVLSYFDLAVVSVLMASLALGLLFFGRPQLFRMLIALPSRLLPRRRTGRLEGASIFENINGSALRQCPACQATIKQGKAGLNHSGSQRYLCRVCGRVYTPAPTPIGYSADIKMRALQMYLEGSSRRSIGRILKISPRTVSNWIANHTIRLPAVPVTESSEVAEPDERFAPIN